MEVDNSKTVNTILKYGLIALLAIAVVVSGVVWWYASTHSTLTIVDAVVTGNAVGVRTRANGTITEILVGDGDEVKRGQTLARMEVRVSEEQITHLARAVELAKQNLSQVEKGTTVSEPTVVDGDISGGTAQAAAHLKRMEELYAIGAVSAREVDEARAAYEESGTSAATVRYRTVHKPASEQALKQSKIALWQAEAALEQAQKASQATEITAPVSGTAYLSEVGEGTEVQAGQVILSVGNAQSFWIEAYAQPDTAELLHLGQFVSYTIGGKTFDGTIMDIELPKEREERTAGTEGVSPEDVHAGKLVVHIALPEKWDPAFRPNARVVVKVSL